MQVLRAAKISRDRRLIHNNVPLTSEKLRSVIDTAVLQASGLPAHTIVAGGRQGCDPHERGFGPLRAEEPIIIDIFPRSQQTGYFGDITRTVVRGRASEGVRRLYDTVLRGQRLAFRKVRAGVPTTDVHRAVQEFFVQQGYKTGKRHGRMEGFFHGTGHGLGLEIHEAPRMGSNSLGELKPGHVVTVEPGLYYPELGGVRLEDVALVTHNGARNLTRFEKVLEI
jgi:Xaa-Pro aminopeptidase